MIPRPPRSTLDRSSAASDVYKRQGLASGLGFGWITALGVPGAVRSMLAPFTALGSGLEWIAYRAGATALGDAMVPTVQRIGQLIGLAIMGYFCLLYTSSSPRDRTRSRMPSSA